MKLIIDEKEIEIPRSEMVIARNAVNSFIAVTKKGSNASQNPVLYLTTLLLMYKKSSELLNELGIENLQYIMEHFGRSEGGGPDTQ